MTYLLKSKLIGHCPAPNSHLSRGIIRLRCQLLSEIRPNIYEPQWLAHKSG
jgi:hypothetical protein